MSSPFIRVDAEGRILGDEGKFSAEVANYLNTIRNGTVATLSANSVPPTIADEPFGDEVLVGGSISGVIDAAGDADFFSVSLLAGQTYMFSLRGTGVSPLNDPFFILRAPDLSIITLDDDGGNGINSIITFTTTADGIYILDARAFPGDPGVGGYTVDVRLQGVDNVGNTNATAGTLSVGTNFNFLETSGDVDRYAVNLVAGQFYTFSLAGGADYATDYLNVPTGELDTILVLRNAAGTILASNDDNSFPGDISSGLGFYATTGGTYYIDALAYPGQTGGYALAFETIDLSTLDPLDSIDWQSANDVPFVDDPVTGVPTAYVYFAAAGESFGELNDAGDGPRESFGWQQHEIDAVMLALEEYEHILGTNYVITTDVNQATFRLMTTTSEDFGAYFYPQDPGYGTQQGIGAFNVDSGGWGDFPQSLERGGFSFAVILHEFGHAHGLAHPHDTGGGSDVMAGVTGSASLGVFDLNQGVYTVMSYNDAWQTHPDGPSSFTIAGIDNGWSATLSAFDIAQLQERYGVHDYNTGNNVYALTDVPNDAFYQTIWDSGGTDVISYSGELDAQIDLTAATLDYSPTGGGVVSFLYNDDHLHPHAEAVKGGFTIAGGVVIENATGGSGNDVLIGNSAANVLTGNNGTDTLLGRDGNDTLNGGNGDDVLNGGAGNDSLVGGNGNDRYIFADAGTDTIVGYQRGEDIDLSALDVSLSDVTIFANRIVVELGANDLTIMFNTKGFSNNDLIFEGSASATAFAGSQSSTDGHFNNLSEMSLIGSSKYDHVDLV